MVGLWIYLWCGITGFAENRSHHSLRQGRWKGLHTCPFTCCLPRCISRELGWNATARTQTSIHMGCQSHSWGLTSCTTMLALERSQSEFSKGWWLACTSLLCSAGKCDVQHRKIPSSRSCYLCYRDIGVFPVASPRYFRKQGGHVAQTESLLWSGERYLSCWHTGTYGAKVWVTGPHLGVKWKPVLY